MCNKTVLIYSDMSIVNGDPDHEVDDAGTIRVCGKHLEHGTNFQDQIIPSFRVVNNTLML